MNDLPKMLHRSTYFENGSLKDIEDSSLKTADDFKGINWDKKMEHDKSAVRCKVEHAFLIVKRQMGYAKVVYRGIAKNMNRFHMLFASANLIMCIRAGRTQDFIKHMV